MSKWKNETQFLPLYKLTYPFIQPTFIRHLLYLIKPLCRTVWDTTMESSSASQEGDTWLVTTDEEVISCSHQWHRWQRAAKHPVQTSPPSTLCRLARRAPTVFCSSFYQYHYSIDGETKVQGSWEICQSQQLVSDGIWTQAVGTKDTLWIKWPWHGTTSGKLAFSDWSHSQRTLLCGQRQGDDTFG